MDGAFCPRRARSGQVIEFPKVVRDAVEEFGDLFASEPQRRHFAESPTGLMVAERKTVLGIHDEFARISDPSCLNRFLTRVDWDVDALNERRIGLLQKQSETTSPTATSSPSTTCCRS